MPVKVNKNGTDYYLVPAPLVTYQKNFERAPNGQLLGTSYTVNLDGTILPQKGNPLTSNSGTVSLSTASWTSTISPDDDPTVTVSESDLLSVTIGKQQKILELFGSGSAVLVSILGYGASTGITFFGNVQSVDFPSDGRWALPSKYQISLLTNSLDTAPETIDFYVSDAQENWSIQETDQTRLTFNGYNLESVNKVYQISHTISAVGKPVYASGGGYLNNRAPWQQASGYVYSVLGVGTGQIVNSAMPPMFSSGYGIANRKVQEEVNELAGSYSLTEEFLAYKTGIAPYPVIETMSVSTTRSENGLTDVQVEGTIQGLDTYQNSNLSNNINSYFNASGYYDAISSHAYNRALNITGLSWIHPIYLTQNVARNINEGTITYSLGYNDRPPNIISGSISENIQISDTYPGQIFASIPVIGRSQPVLQHLNSRTEYTRSLSIDINMGRVTNNWGTGVNNGYWQNATTGNIHAWIIQQKPSVTQNSTFQKIFDAANPANDSGVIPSKVFYSAPTENWNPLTGSYSYQIQWTYNRY